jgi:hypothetical protein
LTSGRQVLELVRILEASSRSLERSGAPVALDPESNRVAVSVNFRMPLKNVPGGNGHGLRSAGRNGRHQNGEGNGARNGQTPERLRVVSRAAA